MCTITIRLDGQGLLVTMNRDELRTRAAEIPPAIVKPHSPGPAWLGPRDGEAGGTWIAVSDRGVVACLANLYGAGTAAVPPDAPTRGEIVPAVLRYGALDAVREGLAARFDPQAYAAFTLFVAGTASAWRYTWRGTGGLESAALAVPWSMHASSGRRTEEVITWRKAAFERWLAQGAAFRGPLPLVHLEQPEGLADRAPLLAREESSTRSITQVFVPCRGEAAELRYWALPQPNAGDPDRILHLPLVADPAPGHNGA